MGVFLWLGVQWSPCLSMQMSAPVGFYGFDSDQKEEKKKRGMMWFFGSGSSGALLITVREEMFFFSFHVPLCLIPCRNFPGAVLYGLDHQEGREK